MISPVAARAAYETWAATYDSDENTTRDLDAAVLRSSDLPLSGASIVELGAGTGKNTVYLAAHASRVVAFDFSAAMLDRARQRCPQPNVTFVEHDIRQPLPVPDADVDLVIGNLVLEHVEQLSPVFMEAWRVLRAGGLLYLCELHPFRQLRGAVARFQSSTGERYVEAYLHLVSDYFEAARKSGFHLIHLAEPSDAPSAQTGEPRLLQMTFQKSAR